MKPTSLTTKLFLDSGDPEETRRIIKLLGFLDGQTTNPSLIAKKLKRQNSKLKTTAQNSKLSEEELLSEYKEIVKEISSLIPHGSVSIEVYADASTSSAQMLMQGKEMFSWIPNAHIKFPTTTEGLKAAYQAVSEGIRVNVTLVFTQEQAAAVFAATLRQDFGELSRAAQGKPDSSLPGFKNVFLSPFIGRLDDRGENGMDLITNCVKMYENGDHHVDILSASIRHFEHLMGSIAAGANILTCPYTVLEEWVKKSMPVPDDSYPYDPRNKKPIPYKELDLSKDWTSFNIHHELTDVGLQKFADDWNAMIGK